MGALDGILVVALEQAVMAAHIRRAYHACAYHAYAHTGLTEIDRQVANG